ncbi:pyridoxamine 5'-phosphate oxidase family protein [Hoeflea prorocentri]|uniref:Pyridoxamine 5'-phosphate oxidase family protein n=1 Tax=Hoeflea prorocentri TaxID=1922333 RepID=A0A9X3UG04_9HYPH|nr:pyridoxamine 5'-phosphate oxidase family protein [Hoeflea prorocentri]MCY6379914.1 pyridoxamine 5'-phosphate oxidase family protein [Hoeflea prorocentri]MDA5397714.1 pyridoxamine 5'-phosphate oxidase family protein [Hoeflea prorocentri]
MLTTDMIELIRNYPAGMVATVNEDRTPSVSPKATFVIIDDRTIAFGNLRSPGTLANIRRHPAVEVCFLDVLARKALRVTGTGSIISKSKASTAMIAAFDDAWGDYLPLMSAFVSIAISEAEPILSPAYDVGHSEADLRAANLKKLNQLQAGQP